MNHDGNDLNSRSWKRLPRDVLVHHTFVAQAWIIAEKTEHRILGESRKSVTLFILCGVDLPVGLHGIEAVVAPQQFETGEIAFGRFHDEMKVSGRNPFVGIEHEDPRSFGQLEPDIACRREIVAPCVMNDFRVEWTDQVEGRVGRAGVNNYDVVDYG